MGFIQIKTEEEKIEQAITRTIAFFDMFDFPLTAFEVWKYCDIECSFSDIFNVLDRENKMPPSALLVGRITHPEPTLIRGIEGRGGFYFLEGRSEIINTRMKRYNIADKKFRRAIWVSRFFKFIPWIKMIAVGNMIGGNNAKKRGDIDFLIITEKGRIWISRFFCVGIIKLFNLRPQKENIQDKICLSFFLAENNLNIENLCLKNGDNYLAYWMASLVPIYDQSSIYKKFIQENKWFRKKTPNWKFVETVSKRKTKKIFDNFYHDIIDVFVGGLDRVFKKIQFKMFPEDLKHLINIDTKVVVSDNILKFHINDRREIYQIQYNKKINEIFRENN